MMLCWKALSIFGAVYRFIDGGDWDRPRRPWDSVRQELRAVVALAPVITCPLRLPWSKTVLMVDASDTGLG